MAQQPQGYPMFTGFSAPGLNTHPNRVIDLGVPYSDTIEISAYYNSPMGTWYLDDEYHQIYWFAFDLANDSSTNYGNYQTISGIPTQVGTYYVTADGAEDYTHYCPCPSNGTTGTNYYSNWPIYTITVVNNNPVLNATTSSPSACGQADGSISLNTTAGHPPFTYSWNTGDTNSTLSNIASGFYSVVVTDVYGLKDTLSIMFGGNTGGMSVTSTTQTAACGNANGAAQVMALGGTAPYTYSWQNGTVGNQLSGVQTGMYQGLVWDSAGCVAPFSVTVPTIPLLSATNIITPVLCANNLSSGAINVSVNAGVQPYSYAWSNGATTQDVTGLPAGNYNLTITDSMGCTLTQTYSVVTHFPNITTMITEDWCSQCYGAINLSPYGGVAPYQINFQSQNYSVATGSSLNLANLCSGNKNIFITDNAGCVVNQVVNVPSAHKLEASLISVTQPSCANDDGQILFYIDGDDGDYTYYCNGSSYWGYDGLNVVPSLVGGYSYNVLVESPYCTSSLTPQISVDLDENILAFGLSAENATNGQNGSAAAYVIWGIPPYTYSWSNGATTDSINNLVPGTYTCTVTTATGCTDVQSVTILNTTSIEPVQLDTKIAISPNPHESSFQIKVNAVENELLHYALFNTLGQEVWLQRQQVYVGENVFPVSTDNLPKGVYFLKVSNNNEQKATLRVIKD